MGDELKILEAKVGRITPVAPQIEMKSVVDFTPVLSEVRKLQGAIVDPLPALEAIRKSWCEVDLELVLQAVRENKSEIRESVTDAILQSKASDTPVNLVPVLRAISDLRVGDLEQLKSQ